MNLMFLSTPPSRVATDINEYSAGHIEVSIHATLAGGDNADSHVCQQLFRVSIHATLAGGDV